VHMETIVCPYCECRVKIADVDSEGGACPECGALITGSVIFGPNRLGFEDDEFDDEGAHAPEGDDVDGDSDDDF